VDATQSANTLWDKVMPILIGAACVLRPLRIEDQAVTLQWRQDLETVLAVMGYRLPVTSLGEQSWFDGALKDQSRGRVTMMIEATNKSPVGLVHLVGVDWVSRVAEFAILIGDKSARGKGVGHDATALMLEYGFRTLNLNRIWLRVTQTNSAAIRVYERLGFRCEGVLRQAFFADGGLQDVLVMGLLAEEWRKPE